MESEGKITDEPTPELDYVYNYTVKKVTEDIDSLNFNTAISQMMIFINECYRVDKVNRDMMISFIKLLSPYAPHMCEEIYHHYTGEDTIAYAKWPTYDPAKLVKNDVEIVVQVNGKVRGRVSAAKDCSQEEVQDQAMALDTVKAQLTGKTVRKVIFVKNKLLNIVAN